MGQIMAAGTFYADLTKKVILVECDVPDNADNRYFLEIVREWGEEYIWVRTWTSSPYFAECLESFENCTLPKTGNFWKLP